jgi:dTDP-4-dehydrorhamnose reductase
VKKIYIAGSGGMLGEAFYEVFKSQYLLKCTDKDVNEPWISHLDFRSYDAYKKDVEEFKPNYLFHLGAFTDLEYCELNEKDSYLTNTLSVEYAVKISNDLKIPLLYISTAGIFDGSKDCFDDWDTANPLGVYARTKFLGEQHVIKNANDYVICRAGWMMGGGPNKDKKFIQKLMSQLKGGSKTLNIVDDKLGTPTYTHDFASNVKHIFESDLRGLFNLVCGGITGRMEVAKELINILNLNSSILINPVPSSFFSEKYFALRPPSERLVNRRLDLYKANKMRDWRVCLGEYIEKYYKDYLK